MKLLNISGYNNVAGLRCGVARTVILFWLLASISCVLILISCAAPKLAGKPSYRGIALNDALSQYRKISSISTVVGLDYEKNDTIMSGDASLSVSPDKLALRIYYLGFLQGEVYEENGKIKSKPKLDRNKSLILVEGLKSSLFWWNITDYKVSETADAYELRNGYRRVVVNKESLLPIEQTIQLENGETLAISYDTPSRIISENGKETADNSPLSWYQSRVKIQLRNYIVRINVKSYSVTR